MTFLVTGGLGLIGHNIVARLQAYESVVVVDNKTTYGIIPQTEIDYLMSERRKKIAEGTPIYAVDIVDFDNVDFVMNKHKPKVIIHCASFPRQKVVNANPAHGADVMMRGLINLLESAKKHKIERFVYISSSMV